MSAEGTSWKILGIVATLLTAVIPAYVAYDLYNPPPDPEKRLELSSITSIDPLKDLSGLRENAAISVTVGDEVFDNFVIGRAYLKNAGNQPILPSDYHKSLSVSVDEPWRIVAVENRGMFGSDAVPLDWIRITNTRFEAEPALLNPGDLVTVTVYLTNTEYQGPSRSEKRPDPKLEWEVRITNLSGFSEPRTILEEYDIDPFWKQWIVVFLVGWAVPFTVATALLFQALYLHFLIRLKLLRQEGWRPIVLILCTSLIGFPAAEAIATYIFRDPFTVIFGVDHGFNLPVIVFNAALLTILWWKAWRIPEKAPLHAR